MDNFYSDPRFDQALRLRETDPALAHEGLLSLRQDYSWGNPVLASLEHEAYMRSLVNRRPAIGVPFGILGPAAYYVAKKTGLLDAQTPASLEQLVAGYGGWMKGIGDLFDG